MDVVVVVVEVVVVVAVIVRHALDHSTERKLFIRIVSRNTNKVNVILLALVDSTV